MLVARAPRTRTQSPVDQAANTLMRSRAWEHSFDSAFVLVERSGVQVSYASVSALVETLRWQNGWTVGQGATRVLEILERDAEWPAAIVAKRAKVSEGYAARLATAYAAIRRALAGVHVETAPQQVFVTVSDGSAASAASLVAMLQQKDERISMLEDEIVFARRQLATERQHSGMLERSLSTISDWQ